MYAEERRNKAISEKSAWRDYITRSAFALITYRPRDKHSISFYKYIAIPFDSIPSLSSSPILSAN